MKTAFLIVNDSNEYRDADVYVTHEATGEEWMFRVYLDKETDTIVECCRPLYAKDENCVFDDSAGVVPQEVSAAYQSVRNEVIEQLKSEVA